MATLQFFDLHDPKWAVEKPFYSKNPFLHTDSANTNVTPTEAQVPIFDMRGSELHFELDKNGFELVKWSHSFADFGSSFKKTGYPAVTRFLKQHFGHHVQVCVFDHIVCGRTAFVYLLINEMIYR